MSQATLYMRRAFDLAMRVPCTLRNVNESRWHGVLANDRSPVAPGRGLKHPVVAANSGELASPVARWRGLKLYDLDGSYTIIGRLWPGKNWIA